MQYVFDFRPAPAVNTLIVIAHDKQIFMFGSQPLDDQILNPIGVLKLVDMNIAEFIRVIFQRFRVFCQQAIGFDQNIVKIERIGMQKFRFIAAINLADQADTAHFAVRFLILIRIHVSVFCIGYMGFRLFQQFFVLRIDFCDDAF